MNNQEQAVAIDALGAAAKCVSDLREQLAAEKTARLKVEVACAEMRTVLQPLFDNPTECVVCRVTYPCADKHSRHGECELSHALSSDCGTGWLSPEVKAKVRDVIQIYLREHKQDCDTCTGRFKEVLALVDAKEGA